MTSRQAKILKALIEEYSASAKPVGSLLLFEKSKFGLSSPTIRNELAKLEEAGYLSHPHTSAGRMPTDKGYRYYVNEIINKIGLEGRPKNRKQLKWRKEQLNSCKNLARIIAEISSNVIFAFGVEESYYTGFSHFLKEPEFNEQINVIMAANLFERIIDRTLDCLGRPENAINVFIGSEISVFREEDSPFSLIIQSLNNKESIIMMGLKRMNYERNIELLDMIKELRG